MIGTNKEAFPYECTAIKAFPGLTEKLIIDFANGIDVVNDHLKVKAMRNGLFNRLLDGLTGTSQEREDQIQKGGVRGQEAALQWLTELTAAHARSNLALAEVQQTANRLEDALAEVTNSLVNTQDQLQHLKRTVNERINDLSTRLERQEAKNHIDMICAKLESGTYSPLPLLQGVYAVLDELYWGLLGDYLRKEKCNNIDDYKSMREYLSNKLIALVNKKNGGVRNSFNKWIQTTPKLEAIYTDSIAYLGDWAKAHEQPFSFAATQPMTDLPLELPLLFDATRAVNAMTMEMFEERVA